MSTTPTSAATAPLKIVEAWVFFVSGLIRPTATVAATGRVLPARPEPSK